MQGALTDGTKPFRALRREALAWFCLAALLTNVAQLLLYMALDAGDVTTVVVLMQLTPILVAALTFAVNRSVERVTVGTVVGGGLAVVGAILVVLAR